MGSLRLNTGQQEHQNKNDTNEWKPIELNRNPWACTDGHTDIYACINWKFHEEWNIKRFKVSPHKILSDYEGKKYKFTVEKLGRHHPNQVIKVHITRMGQIKIICHLIGCTQHHCCVIPSINGLLEANYEEMPDEPKLGEVLQNN